MDFNVRSMNTAYEYEQNTTFDSDWFHDSYFLQFSFLQKAMDCEANALSTSLQDIMRREPEAFNFLEAAVRVPSYLLTETRDWEAAAEFSLIDHYPYIDSSVWNENPWTLVIRIFLNLM